MAGRWREFPRWFSCPVCSVRSMGFRGWVSRCWMSTCGSWRHVSAEHGAGAVVRSEGVLRRGGQAPLTSGRPTCCVHRGAARAAPRHNVVRLDDGEAGLAASTIKRRLATVSGLVRLPGARGVVTEKPGAAELVGAARVGHRCGAARWCGRRGRLPRILGPDEVDRAGRGAADRPGPGHGVADAARRAAPLRGAGAAAGRSHARVSGGCSSPRARVGISGSFRSATCSSRALAAYFAAGAARRSWRRPGVRGAEGAAPRAGR